MLIKALTTEDIPAWLAIAHESDSIVSRMIGDVAVFYTGFKEYMVRKIEQQEAFMATDVISRKCLGIIAFSKNNNRISYIGITEKTSNFSGVGSKLVEFALKQLDNSKEITANVIRPTAGIFKQELALYKSFSFIETDDKITENGIPAIKMKKSPPERTSIR